MMVSIVKHYLPLINADSDIAELYHCPIATDSQNTRRELITFLEILGREADDSLFSSVFDFDCVKF